MKNITCKNILLIIKREFKTRVMKKYFIITTLLVPLLFGGLMILPAILTTMSGDKQRIAVVDDSHLFEGKLADNKSLYFITDNTQLEELKKTYKSKNYTGILYIPAIDINNPNGITYYSENQLGLQTKQSISSKLEDILRKVRIKSAGYDTKIIEKLDEGISITDKVLGEEEKQGNSGLASILGYISGFLIYIVLIFYGTSVMKGVAEEKTNRIIEVIISTVKPIELLMGKIIGIGLVGLTQFFIWFVLMLSINMILGLVFADEILQYQNTMMQGNDLSQMHIDSDEMGKMLTQVTQANWALIIPSFFFFFFMGYLLYAAMFAAVGSMVNEDSDTQSFTMPVILPIIFSIFIMMRAIEQPNSGLAVFGSIFPLTSPVVMLARIPFGIPSWQIVVSMISLIIGFIFMTWVASKIYRTGILMYGKKITFKEVIKWLKY